MISLSGETRLAEYHVDALAAVPRLRVPLLIVDARHDAYLPVVDARSLLRRAGTDDRRALFLPGAWHGWEIVEDAPYAENARALVLAWIRTHT